MMQSPKQKLKESNNKIDIMYIKLETQICLLMIQTLISHQRMILCREYEKFCI